MKRLSPFEKNLIYKAIEFMKKKHREVDQKRKYTGEEYHVHPLEVYAMVKKYLPEDYVAQIAALLHDTVEDTKTTLDEIEKEFGKDVMLLVSDLTDISKPSDGNRSTRKEIDRQHTKQADPRAKTIKLCDLISNSKSIVKHDPEFANTYLKEKEKLMEVLEEGHPAIYAMAMNLLQENLKHLKQRK